MSNSLHHKVWYCVKQIIIRRDAYEIVQIISEGAVDTSYLMRFQLSENGSVQNGYKFQVLTHKIMRIRLSQRHALLYYADKEDSYYEFEVAQLDEHVFEIESQELGILLVFISSQKKL
jgi:hypothetical protein